MQSKGGNIAVPQKNRRYLGVETGLGMAPFLVHPCLLNSWIMAREVAFARVTVPESPPDQIQRAEDLLVRAHLHCLDWQVEDAIQMQRIHILRGELKADYISARPPNRSFADLYQRAENAWKNFRCCWSLS